MLRDGSLMITIGSLDIDFFDVTYIDSGFHDFDGSVHQEDFASNSHKNGHIINKNLVIDNFDFTN